MRAICAKNESGTSRGRLSQQRWASLSQAFRLRICSFFSGLTIAITGQFSALPVVNALLPSVLRGPALAGGVALYNTMAQFGGFFGPIVIGVLKQETESYAAGPIALAIAVTSSAAVTIALGRALSPRTVPSSIARA